MHYGKPCRKRMLMFQIATNKLKIGRASTCRRPGFESLVETCLSLDALLDDGDDL